LVIVATLIDYRAETFSTSANHPPLSAPIVLNLVISPRLATLKTVGFLEGNSNGYLREL